MMTSSSCGHGDDRWCTCCKRWWRRCDWTGGYASCDPRKCVQILWSILRRFGLGFHRKPPSDAGGTCSCSGTWNRSRRNIASGTFGSTIGAFGTPSLWSDLRSLMALGTRSSPLRFVVVLNYDGFDFFAFNGRIENQRKNPKILIQFPNQVPREK